LDDSTEVNCYEIILQPQVRIEQSKVAIQYYVRKMLTSGQAALINFISPTYENTWRLTLVAKDSIFTENGVKEKTTHAKRFTYLLGPSETCKTAAERFEAISTEKQSSFELLVKAFSVERLSKIFFDEYKYVHYSAFVEAILGEKLIRNNKKEDEWVLTGKYSNFFVKAFLEKYPEIEAKANARNFVKKLLGRIVFLYFVQKKGWMGATNAEYTDGDPNFMMNLFLTSGGNESFYSVWLTRLFFETLNTKERKDDFKLPNGNKVKIPYLNGGLFDNEDHDKCLLVLKPILFHNPENEDDPTLRGFLNFLNSFNFTVFEDSPEEHTIAVDPEMLGHIFENLLEDNKDKGAFYTPKEIVHYMCQESLTEYLATHLSKEYTHYKTEDKIFLLSI
jgi:adenine-specific DNA-methyltransferase